MAALVAGQEDYAIRCVQTALIIRACGESSRQTTKLYFDGLINGKREARELRKDVVDAMSKLRERISAPAPPSLRLQSGTCYRMESALQTHPDTSVRHQNSSTKAPPFAPLAVQMVLPSSLGPMNVPRMAEPRDFCEQKSDREAAGSPPLNFSPLSAAFSDIPLGNFEQCRSFLEASPAILTDDHDYWQEAITALGAGRPNHSNNCIQQALIVPASVEALALISVVSSLIPWLKQSQAS